MDINVQRGSGYRFLILKREDVDMCEFISWKEFDGGDVFFLTKRHLLYRAWKGTSRF